MKDYATYVGDLDGALDILERTLESMGLSKDRPEEGRERGTVYVYPDDNREEVYVDGELVATLRYDAKRCSLHYKVED